MSFSQSETYQHQNLFLYLFCIGDEIYNEHIKYTGVSNEKILKNIEWLKQSGKEFIFRIPLIPDITDTKENLSALSKLVQGYNAEYLPYNQMAGSKYKMLGMEYTLK